MSEKRFKISADKIVQLIPPMGSCLASDMITVDGKLVGFMYREERYDNIDSGWRFFSGLEDDEYVNDPANLMLYDVNTIASYDPGIITYMDLEIGCELERSNDGVFRRV